MQWCNDRQRNLSVKKPMGEQIFDLFIMTV